VVQWDGAETGLELLSRADQRVYLGKNSGAGKKTG
jgi:hypothetical protein